MIGKNFQRNWLKQKPFTKVQNEPSSSIPTNEILRLERNVLSFMVFNVLFVDLILNKGNVSVCNAIQNISSSSSSFSTLLSANASISSLFIGSTSVCCGKIVVALKWGRRDRRSAALSSLCNQENKYNVMSKANFQDINNGEGN